MFKKIELKMLFNSLTRGNLILTCISGGGGVTSHSALKCFLQVRGELEEYQPGKTVEALFPHKVIPGQLKVG